MHRLLVAIETSGPTGSVAAALDGDVMAEDTFEKGMRHGRELVPRLAALCERIGRAPRSIGIVAVSQGPGSYTGVRVGVTCAKTLAFATRAAVVGVSTLEALAQNADSHARHVAVIMDARRDEVYAAYFERRGEDLARVGPDEVMSAGQALERCPPGAQVLGDAVQRYPAVFDGASAEVRLADGSLGVPHARHVARLGWRAFLAGRIIPAHDLMPIYLRRPMTTRRS